VSGPPLSRFLRLKPSGPGGPTAARVSCWVFTPTGTTVRSPGRGSRRVTRRWSQDSLTRTRALRWSSSGPLVTFRPTTETSPCRVCGPHSVGGETTVCTQSLCSRRPLTCQNCRRSAETLRPPQPEDPPKRHLSVLASLLRTWSSRPRPGTQHRSGHSRCATAGCHPTR